MRLEVGSGNVKGLNLNPSIYLSQVRKIYLECCPEKQIDGHKSS